MKYLLAIALLAIAAVAADEKPSSQPAVPEVTRLRLVNSFQRALANQNALNAAKEAACAKDPDCQKAQSTFNTSVTDLQGQYQAAKAELKLPADEELAIDANAPKPEDQVKIRKVDSSVKK